MPIAARVPDAARLEPGTKPWERAACGVRCAAGAWDTHMQDKLRRIRVRARVGEPIRTGGTCRGGMHRDDVPSGSRFPGRARRRGT